MEIKVEKPTNERLKELGVSNWGKWECPVSRFNWEYDCDERCYILEGEVNIETKEGNTKIEKGDVVLFPKGLKCTWDVKKEIKKVYRFE
ncbi:MAG: cupin domain-containing protein [bacterium]